MLAALQAPIIMMSQNRQVARDRLAAGLDYEINLKAELEIMDLHKKMEDMQVGQIGGATAARTGAISPVATHDRRRRPDKFLCYPGSVRNAALRKCCESTAIMGDRRGGGNFWRECESGLTSGGIAWMGPARPLHV